MRKGNEGNYFCTIEFAAIVIDESPVAVSVWIEQGQDPLCYVQR